jgi:hypothetical protein
MPANGWSPIARERVVPYAANAWYIIAREMTFRQICRAGLPLGASNFAVRLTPCGRMISGHFSF